MSTSNEPKPKRFKRKPKDPNNPGRIAQMKQVYKLAAKHYKALPWILAAAVLGGGALGALVGLLLPPIWLWIILGLMVGVLGATFILGRFAETAAFEEMRGKPGAYGAVLNTVRKSWLADDEPVAVDPKTRDLVYRATGRGGVVLVGEGPAGRVAKLVDKERKRHERVLPGVPVNTLLGGEGEGQIPMNRLTKEVYKIPRKLNKSEVLVIRKRLTALGTISKRAPIPKGIDPSRARPDRRAMRGR
ncbi:DUF4191 domain-containing protein [Brevibacterium sp. 50QC2O2]|jgi:hypothetical protein|uniref:DUF4191 domain-containing protein n=1 Tax=Brevibacterium TaxID=1696 RepID=UPI00211BD3C6|nr:MULTISPECIES: DUF4191 domain-containing protein [unclassified Brevibacterium]MCQ9366673.1 DUF4191 domain-containing protein [Brevibacterium sp. 91QC2O2]MCQ9384350.1 DUF4191 domain-containing protein [Brevibacterium sp. 68QC2CO]MCQ9389587.1 DUF4191 domain-containing protein [Brevibacterium sp. 50QC2O2]